MSSFSKTFSADKIAAAHLLFSLGLNGCKFYRAVAAAHNKPLFVKKRSRFAAKALCPVCPLPCLPYKP